MNISCDMHKYATIPFKLTFSMPNSCLYAKVHKRVTKRISAASGNWLKEAV
jgi:hypothetical protein